ncbi:hypothetical protein [Lactiplantibacillus plantarum]|nr:hypothetical protein [Lactiplantibacillus plantarum]
MEFENVREALKFLLEYNDTILTLTLDLGLTVVSGSRAQLAKFKRRTMTL